MLITEFLQNDEIKDRKITYDYAVPKSLEKQFYDFCLLSALYQYNHNKHGNYFQGYKINQELGFILNDSVQKIVNAQKRFLQSVILSIIAIEMTPNEKTFVNDFYTNKFINLIHNIKLHIGLNSQEVYATPDYYSNISKLMKKLDLSQDSILRLVKKYEHEKFIDAIKLLERLKQNDTYITIISINMIYDFIQHNKFFQDKLPLGNFAWSVLFKNRSDRNIKEVIRKCSIPQRVVGYLIKYKGLEKREDIINSKTINVNDLNDIKRISQEFLKHYFNKNSTLIKRVLYKEKIFQELYPPQVKYLIQVEASDAISYDLVYNNKKIPEKESAKIMIAVDERFLPSFEPFRIYEYKKRRNLSIKLDETSRYKKMIEDTVDEDKKIPYAIHIPIGEDFYVSLEKFIDENNIVLPSETRIHELEKFEIENLGL